MSKIFLAVLAVLITGAAGAVVYFNTIDFEVTQVLNPLRNDDNPPDNPTPPDQPVSQGKTIDDWKYSDDSVARESIGATAGIAPQAKSMGGAGGATMNAMNAAPSMMMDSTIGLATGGAKDVNNFRENIKNGYLPLATDITYEGLYYDYYFDTGKQQECTKLFCPSYSKAVSADPFSKDTEYYLTVGLNSGIKESDFSRKKLNLVVVMDISGSMGSAFNSYYYDQYGNYKTITDGEKLEASKSKMKIATEAVAAMTKHLNADDRFGVVLFDESAYLAKPLSLVGNTDMDKIRQHILDITEQGSTNMEAGIKEGTKLFQELEGVNPNEYENRIIFLTDAQPNTGNTSEEGFIGLANKNADNKIYMTFIGIGVDFNTELIESITKMRGANYYSVHSSKEFITRMDDEFDYMVTPLVFDLELKMQADGYKIMRVYGSPEADMATGSLMKVNTLFPSKNTAEGSKGGIVLLQLKKISDGAKITLTTSYEDRSGNTSGESTTINFDSQEPEYFDNSGIRKGILLARYANVIKDWINDERGHYQYSQPWVPLINNEDGIYLPPIEPPAQPSQWERQSLPLAISDSYKKLFETFADYFSQEMAAINDNDLQKEVEIIGRLKR